MVKVNEIKFNHVAKTAQVSLFADNQSEITSGMTVNGVPSDYTLEAGSSCMTASKEFGYLDSNGTWNW